jgi:excinuclease ABC subunit C
MVVWEGGKPKKSDYRRYKDQAPGRLGRLPLDRGDGRTPLHAPAEGRRALPTSCSSTGARGQLSSAVAALDQLGLGDLPVASIAKREEEIFVEGRGDPIVLPA